MKEKRKIWLTGAVIFWVCFFAHFSALRGDFHFDDFHHIIDNPSVKNPPGFLYFFTHPESFSSISKGTLYRPITLLSFALNHKLAGEKASGWLIINLLLHSFNVLVFFLLLYRWTRNFRSAVSGGLLFSVMAILAQPVNYLSNRATLLAVFFLLLALLSDGLEPSGKTSQKILRVLLSGLFYWLGMLSKEIAVIFPALALIEDWFLKNKKYERRRGLAYLFYWINFGIFLLLRFTLFQTVGSYFYPRSFLENLFTQAKVIFYYLFKIFFPVHLSVLPEFALSKSFTEPLALISIFAIVIISGLGIIFRKKIWWLGFSWFWFLLALSPTSLIPLNVLASEERVYLASLGVILVLALFFEWVISHWRLVGYVFFGLILIFQVLLLEQRIQVFRSEFSLWEDAIYKSPHLSNSYVMFGNALADAGRRAQALSFYQRALFYDPKNGQALAGITKLYISDDQPELVEKIAQRYLESAQHPSQKAEALSFLAFSALERKRLMEAEELAKKAIENDPRQGNAYYVLARIYYLKGDKILAEQYARKAIELYPDMALAQALLGLILAETEKVEQAIPHLEKVVELSPSNAPGWLNLGLAYYQKGELDKAKEAMKKAIGLKSGYALAHYHLALIEYQANNYNQAESEMELCLQLDPEMVSAHFAYAQLLLTRLEKGRFFYPEVRQWYLEALDQEIKWLKEHHQETSFLENRLKELIQK